MDITSNHQSSRGDRRRELSSRSVPSCGDLEEVKGRPRMNTAAKQRPLSPSFLVGWLLLALCLCSSMKTATGNDDNYNNNDDGNVYQNDDGSFYYNNGQGNYNRYYDYQGDDAANAKNGNGYNNNEAYQNYYYNNGNGNGNNNNGNGNYNGNYNNDDANNNNGNYNNGNYNNDDANNDDANNDDGNGNDEGKYYNYDALAYNDVQLMDDNIEIDSFDGVSISPVSCVNYNNGHMIKFEIYETENSYQCHFAQIGSFVVSIAHYMRAYFNYQALTYGNSFTLPDDVGYLNCIPLKMESYGFDFVYGDGDDANADGDNANRRRVEEGEQKQQAILYAKVGCRAKETFSSTAFQLFVFSDEKCTEPYDDGQTDQAHASRGYEINLDKFYAANLDEDDDNVKYTDYPVNTLSFSSKVSFRPHFYSCQSCKPSKISDTFNKFSGTYYDDLFISNYGMTQNAYSLYLAELEAQKQEENCDNCQYFTYDTDDGSADDYTVQQVDDAYFSSVDDDLSNAFVDDYNNHDDNNNNRQLRLSSTAGEQQLNRSQSFLVPDDKEFKKYEFEFWKAIDTQLEHRDRSLYEDGYGGVDDWNMCEQVYRYGLFCDEQCQELDAFRANQWSGADIVLITIMCTFIASMMLLIAAKHQRASSIIRKQQSFYSANDYDPRGSGFDTGQIPGLPPMVMLTLFIVVMIITVALAVFNFVNETLVFAVVCCILLFIYMLKITLFSVQRRPVLLASPNHEDVFGYSNAAFGKKKGGFFS